MTRLTHLSLDQANQLLPLVRSIAKEILERRKHRQKFCQLREKLEDANTPEGLTTALADLDSRIFEHDEGLRLAQRELNDMGLTVLRLHPLTIHIPGQTRNGEVVFCWQEGEDRLCHGHLVGEEEEPRRPLKLRVV